jgi:5'-deoxynucleotidase YfbR-like HD superfamily hydrolase
MSEGIIRLFGDDELSLVHDEIGAVIEIIGDYPSEPITVHGTTYDVHQRHIDFLNTDYGRRMQDIYRFGGYLAKTTASLDGDETAARTLWREWLGPDVVLATHEAHTARLARFVIERETRTPLTVVEGSQLLFVALHHDKGESVVGDISRTEKTSEDEAAEEAAIIHVLSEVYPEYGEEELALILHATEANQSIDFENTKVRSIFDTIELIGYYDTALMAQRAAQVAERPHDKALLREMSHVVARNWYPQLTTRARDLSSFEAYLHHTQPLYEQTLTTQ